MLSQICKNNEYDLDLDFPGWRRGRGGREGKKGGEGEEGLGAVLLLRGGILKILYKLQVSSKRKQVVHC